jgi:pimeloyl-ACP methyl ester carboxylesterase
VPYTSIAGCDLFYETGGQGAPVVYVHGGFASLDTVLRDLKPGDWSWERDFAAQFHLITYDRRGCYRSSSPDRGYDLMTQVHDLTGLLDHLQVANTHLIGSSAGGPIALLFAAAQPHRTRSLILVGTAFDLFPLGEPSSEIVRQHLGLLERDGAQAAFDQRPSGVEVTFGELWDQAEARARGKLDEYLARQQHWRAQAQQLPRAQRVHYYVTELRSMQAYMALDVRPYAPAVQAPTYVIYGSNDQLVPLADAQELAQAIPAAQLDVIPGGSHGLMIQDAEARRRVMAFMHAVDAQ